MSGEENVIIEPTLEEETGIITGLLKLDKRNHGRGATVFINYVIAEVFLTLCRIPGTCDQ